ncbi:MAG: xanthine dehydrogenase family protein molybdopterin-binding subunit, partial [Salinirussus sp.]
MTAEHGAGSPGAERTASVGVSLERREDRPLLTGNASFTDDLVGPRHLHVAAARSQYAHATIQSIDTADAETLEEVHGVFTATDLVRADLREGYPVRHVPEGIDEELPDRPLLANEKVRYQGEPIAVVAAETREGARGAADAISVEYDRLDAVTDPQSAESADATVHESSPSNRAFTWTAGDVDATKAAFEAAEQSVSLDLSNQRLAPVPIEPRALVAEYSEGEIDVRMSTQTPHHHRTFFAAALGLPESSIRVRAPSVGGGFGSKDHFYAIEALACWMATKFSRPVAAQVQRGETFQTDAHGRGHETVASLAVDNDGTIRGLRAKTTADLGAYISTSAAAITTNAYGRMLSGAYAIPSVYCEVDGVFTNTAPTGAYRGAGRPEATFVVERLVSLAATELGLDPVEFRRRNLIDADDFPYQTPVGFTYDSGDYERSLDAALELVDYEAVRECQAARQSDDRYLGIGISTFVEVAGYGPIGDGGDGPIPPLYEGGRVRFHPDGHVTAYCGTADQGQGHETTYAQVLADVLGVDYEDIEVVEADTEVVAYGTGTFGSRSASVGTASLVESAERVVEKARRIAAEALEVATS